MRVSFTAALAGAMLLFMAGCHSPAACTHPDTGVSIESYVEALDKVKENLGKIDKGYAEALDRAKPAYVPELKEARLGLVSATITLCDDALLGSKAVPDAPAEGGDQ